MAITTAPSLNECSRSGTTVHSRATTRSSTPASAPACRRRRRPTSLRSAAPARFWRKRPSASETGRQAEMAAGTSDITFVIPGQAAAAPESTISRGRVKTAVRGGATRTGAEPVRVWARPGEDVVVLDIANGPRLVLHPQDALDLMRAQAAAPSRGAATASANEVVVPAQLGWPGLEAQATRGATRGWMGQALLSGFHVLTGLAKDPAAELAAAAITAKVDGAVGAGVYRLAAEVLGPLKASGRKVDAVPAAGDGGPLLVLVHGTFS